MTTVVNAIFSEKRRIIHEMDNGEKKRYQTVRGGVSWPVMAENLPAYYCIFGEEEMPYEEPRPMRGKLQFLCEFEAPDIYTSLDSFFMKLTDDAVLYLCERLYTVTEEFQGEDYRGYVEAFQGFAYEKGPAGRLEQAPWAERPDLGMYHIKSWIDRGLLKIPDGTLLQEQLRMVRADEVKAIPTRLNAVNALRFVVCGFEKDRPNDLCGFQPRRSPPPR